LLTLEEQERKDFARDLHDEVGPLLFAINMDTASASRLLDEGRATAAREQVQAIAEAVRHTQQQVKSMLGRLRPTGLADFGLREATENIVAFWRRRRPEIDYTMAIPPECEGLSEVLGTTICRIIQEALSNAVRHAEPTMITISVERRDQHGRDEVRLEIADNGRGMPEPPRLGHGLIGMTERVKAIGGDLTLLNRPGQGFTLGARLPIPSARDVDVASIAAKEAER
jgi:two-component system sensor histidine kinase UhpB